MKETTTILLSQYYFSKEAINFITANYVVYLPALATLANLAAKEIDNSYYDLKSDMVDEISQVATSQGWRTFETLDYNVPNHPYIYYVDCNRFAQMSFHGNYSRPTTTTKGKWSGVAVQEQAPTLIANRLKKDGFKGNVWDLKQITLNLMYGQNVVEAAHLYKGQNYLFVANNELVVLQGNTVVEPTDSLLQSFITRFRKNESPSSEQSEKGVESSDQNQSKGEQQGNTEQTNSTNGNDAESADSQNCGTNGGKTPLTQNSQSNANGLNEYAQQVTSEELGELITEDNGIAKQSPEEFANSGNNLENSSQGHDDLHEFQGDLGTQKPQKEVFEGEQSENSNTLKNSIMQVSGNNTKKGSANGANNYKSTFIEELQNLAVKKSEKANFDSNNEMPYIDPSSFKGKPRANQVIAEALRKIASGTSFSQKESGSFKFDCKKVVKALVTLPNNIAKSKFDRPKVKTYFFIDTNCKNCGNEHCSWVNYSEFSLMLIETAKQNENIAVWSGSKCRPEINQVTGKKVFEKKHELQENIALWIQQENPEKGSTLVFWGEAYNISFNKAKMKKLLQEYKVVWLDSLKEENSFFKSWKNHNKHTTVEDLRSCGIKVIKNCDTKEGFARGINSLL